MSIANWRVPYIETTQRPDTVNLYLPMLALLDEDVKQGLVKVFGKGIVNVSHNYLTTLSLAQRTGEERGDSASIVKRPGED